MPPHIFVFIFIVKAMFIMYLFVVKCLYTLGWLRKGATLLVVQCELLLEAVQFGGRLHSVYCSDVYGFSVISTAVFY